MAQALRDDDLSDLSIDEQIELLRDELASLRTARETKAKAHDIELQEQHQKYQRARQVFLSKAGKGNSLLVYQQALREVFDPTHFPSPSILRKLSMLLFLLHHDSVLKQGIRLAKKKSNELTLYSASEQQVMVNETKQLKNTYHQLLQESMKRWDRMNEDYQNQLKVQMFALAQLENIFMPALKAPFKSSHQQQDWGTKNISISNAALLGAVSKLEAPWSAPSLRNPSVADNLACLKELLQTEVREERDPGDDANRVFFLARNF
jgi:hypothetical protein